MSEQKMMLAGRISKFSELLQRENQNRKDLSLSTTPGDKDLSLSTLTALEKALLAGETHYTVRPGIPELRRRIAVAIQARGGMIPDAKDPADNVLITTSESEALFVILLGLGLESGEILTQTPSSCRHQALLGLRGLRLETEWGSAARAIYRPIHLSETDHARLLRCALESDLPDILDLSADWSSELPRCDLRRTLIIGNLNGIKGLSLFRVGYLMAPRALIARCRPWKQAFSICTAAPSQRVAVLRLTEEGS